MDLRAMELLKEIKYLITNKPKSDNWLDMNQAAAYTSCSKSTLYRNLKAGFLKASNQTGKYLFKRSALDNWLS